jgi:hypothetical protein
MKIGTGVQARLSVCVTNLKCYDVGIVDESDFMMYAVEMGLGGVLYLPSASKIDSG